MNKEYTFDKQKSVEPINSTSNVTRRILSSDANAPRLAVVTLFCLFLLFIILIVFSLPLSFLEIPTDVEAIPMEINAIIYASFLLQGACLVFVFLPVVSGVMFFVKSTVDGAHPKLADIFLPFRGVKRYFRSILLSAVVAVRIMLVVLPLVGGILKLPIFNEGYAQSSLFIATAESAFVLFVTFAAVAVGAYISTYLYFVPYLVVAHNRGLIPAVIMSVRLARTRRMEMLRMSLRSVLYTVLSAVSLLVIWVICAMPHISVSYFVYCDSVIRDELVTNE